MSDRPTVGLLAEIAYEQMAPVAVGDEARGWPLLKFLNAYYLPMQQVYDIVRDRDDLPGWGILFDPDQCPERYLPYLAMFAGVRLRTGMSEDEKRERIKERDGTKRCTPAAIIKTAKAHLTGTQAVTLRERYNPSAPGVDSPGYFELVTYASETPDADRLIAVIRQEQKDVGLIAVIRQIAGQDWQQVVDSEATWQAVEDAYPTWNDLIEDTP